MCRCCSFFALLFNSTMTHWLPPICDWRSRISCCSQVRSPDFKDSGHATMAGCRTSLLAGSPQWFWTGVVSLCYRYGRKEKRRSAYADRIASGSFIIPHSSVIIRRSSFIMHQSSSIIHQSSSISHHSSVIILIHHSSFIIHHPSSIIQQSSSISHQPSIIIHQSRSDPGRLCASLKPFPLLGLPAASALALRAVPWRWYQCSVMDTSTMQRQYPYMH